ncbi:MAG: hypothetical protein HQL78_07275 [Magnetococcales bacterium]|nr:hypothetical protein [Magnetococcales bacterium]MBF0419952.1 hypothetical protein [Magnetococcales bacterium]
MSTEHEEGAHEGEIDGEEKSAKKGRGKEILFLVSTIVIAIIVGVVLNKLYNKSSESTAIAEKKSQEIIEKKLAERKVVLRGHFSADKIPGLEKQETQSPVEAAKGDEASGDKQAQSTKDKKVDEDSSVKRTPKGDKIYTQGNKKLLGAREEAKGVVILDRIRVGVDDYKNRVIQGRITNQGSRNLAYVEAKVDFTESGGNIVQSRLVNPLVVAGGIFGDQVQTLSPGENRRFQLDASDLPESWTGSVTMEVKSYHFVP